MNGSVIKYRLFSLLKKKDDSMINLPCYILFLYLISRLKQAEFLAASTKSSFTVLIGLVQLIFQKLSKKVQNTCFHVLALFPCLFFHVSLKIDFNLLPKSTFNFMEGRKLCTAFVSRFRANISVTTLKTCYEKKN